MQIKDLEISGWIHLHGDYDDKDIFLEKKKKDGENSYYYYPDADALGEIITSHFMEVEKVPSFNPNYDDWTQGQMLTYKDVFVRYYVSDVEMTWEQAEESHIKKMAGSLVTDHQYTGYSEYTITDSWTDVFVGAHDLRKELSTYEGKYVLIKISYKVK